MPLKYSNTNITALRTLKPDDIAQNVEEEDFLTMFEDYQHILIMYLVHALPYTQSAFNWLFYAFLNRNLRQSARCPISARSGVALPFDATTNGHNGCNPQSGTNALSPVSNSSRPGSSLDRMMPFWKNIQFFGSYLKTAATESSSNVLRHAPFLLKARSK